MTDDESMQPDDVIQPDGVIPPPPSNSEDLAERAVDVLTVLLRRASALAGGVLMFAVLACAIGYLLGIAALSGGLRLVWIIGGGALALWAIGSVLAAMFRLRAVRRGSDLLVDEVRSLIDDADSERTVIDTVESTEGSDDDGIVHLSRQFFSLRDVVKEHRSNFSQLSLALASITLLPGAMALATVIGFTFAGLSVIFGLILIF